MENLILTLMNIPRVGRKTISYYIEQLDKFPKDEKDIIEGFTQVHLMNSRIRIPKIEDIKVASEKCSKLVEESKHYNIKSIDIFNKDFPIKLRYIKDSPQILFYKGNYDAIKNENSLAIIGSREPSEDGIRNAYKLGNYFGKENYTVVSGLAIGCDEAAHKGCLDGNGTTVAVIPGGIDNIYPVKNKSLSDEILKNNGCLVSEYPVGFASYKNNFIERDRIQSGLSAAVLVVEANLNSGTMHTVNFALEQNRILACCNLQAQGNEKIIKEHNAIIINRNNSLEDIKYEINKFNYKIKNSTETKQFFKQIKFEL